MCCYRSCRNCLDRWPNQWTMKMNRWQNRCRQLLHQLLERWPKMRRPSLSNYYYWTLKTNTSSIEAATCFCRNDSISSIDHVSMIFPRVTLTASDPYWCRCQSIDALSDDSLASCWHSVWKWATMCKTLEQVNADCSKASKPRHRAVERLRHGCESLLISILYLRDRRLDVHRRSHWPFALGGPVSFRHWRHIHKMRYWWMHRPFYALHSNTMMRMGFDSSHFAFVSIRGLSTRHLARRICEVQLFFFSRNSIIFDIIDLDALLTHSYWRQHLAFDFYDFSHSTRWNSICIEWQPFRCAPLHKTTSEAIKNVRNLLEIFPGNCMFETPTGNVIYVFTK